ncbi:IS1 family transposase [Thalassoporum mexicanum]|uniref:IS1 family transposase n=1 Tax=Thalassoporum mexicanum TaxID=3457544 RepID=UPI0012E9FEEF|nr:IS1 family transposase [Pseudanabaena sp. PCC 7367]
MDTSKLTCPRCNSLKIVKNGKIHNGKQNFKCKQCNRQFVANSKKKYIANETKAQIDKLLLERVSLAGIARVVGVSPRWLQQYVNHKYAQVPQQVQVQAKKRGHLTIQMDELWSFVGKKRVKVWVWLAIDVDTKEIVGVYIGSRDEVGAQGLWQSLPPVYRQCAVCYTDFWRAYAQVVPSMRHQPVDKGSGLTNKIERFNCTLRQRASRLVRKSLSFSKKLANHVGAIWLFVHHYNSSLLV